MTRAVPVHPLELISAQIDGEISPGETKFLGAHLRTCASCQQRQAELRRIAAGLDGMPVAAPPAGAIERLLERLLHDCRPPLPPPAAPAPPVVAEPQAEQTAPWRSRAILAVPLALAAALAVVLLVFRMDTPVDTPADPAAPQPSPTVTEDRSPAAVPIVPPPISPAASVTPAEVMSPPAAPVPRITPPVEPPAALARPDEVPRSAAPAVPDDTLPPAALPVPPEVVEAEQREPSADPVVLPTIEFRGSSKQLNRQARQLIATVAEFLRQHQDVKLVIRGHAEAKSTDKSLALGQSRALAVARHLEDLGIDPARLVPTPAGNEDDRVDFALER